MKLEARTEMEYRKRVNKLFGKEFFVNAARHIPLAYMSFKALIFPFLYNHELQKDILSYVSNLSIEDTVKGVVGFSLIGLGLYVKKAVDKTEMQTIISNAKSRNTGVQKMAKTGMYSESRNPVYTSQSFIAVGNFILSPSTSMFVAFGTYLFITKECVSLEEERCESIFGAKYMHYKQMTPRWPSLKGLVRMVKSAYKIHKSSF